MQVILIFFHGQVMHTSMFGNVHYNVFDKNDILYKIFEGYIIHSKRIARKMIPFLYHWLIFCIH